MNMRRIIISCDFTRPYTHRRMFLNRHSHVVQHLDLLLWCSLHHWYKYSSWQIHYDSFLLTDLNFYGHSFTYFTCSTIKDVLDKWDRWDLLQNSSELPIYRQFSYVMLPKKRCFCKIPSKSIVCINNINNTILYKNNTIHTINIIIHCIKGEDIFYCKHILKA